MDDEYKAFRGYFEANRMFIHDKAEINIALVNTFLGVCMWGYEKDQAGDPLTMLEIADRIGIPYTTVSRHLRYLGDGDRQTKGGLGLVKTVEYIHNKRQKTVELTQKGKSFRDRLLHTLDTGTKGATVTVDKRVE